MHSETHKSWFLGRGWGQQLFSFQSPAVHWMARTSSLNCLSCWNPYPTPHSLNAYPLFTENTFFCSLKSASSHPLPKNRLVMSQAVPTVHCMWLFKGIFSTHARLKCADTLSTNACRGFGRPLPPPRKNYEKNSPRIFLCNFGGRLR